MRVAPFNRQVYPLHDYSRLWQLTLFTACIKLVSLLLLPLIPNAIADGPRPPKKEDGQQEEEESRARPRRCSPGAAGGGKAGGGGAARQGGGQGAAARPPRPRPARCARGGCR